MTGLAATPRKLPPAAYPYGIRKDERSEDGIASADRNANAQSQGGPLQDRYDMTGLAATSRKLPPAAYPYGIRKDALCADGIVSADRNANAQSHGDLFQDRYDTTELAATSRKLPPAANPYGIRKDALCADGIVSADRNANAQSQGGPLQDRYDMTGLATTSRKLPLATYPYGIRKDALCADGIVSADRVRRNTFVLSRASVTISVP